MKHHILIASLYPTRREKGFASKITTLRGIKANNSSLELVF